MPELPEVETVVRTLRPRLVGATVSCVTLFRRDIVKSLAIDVPQQLVGRSFQGVLRRGKKILLLLDHGTVCIHLGMSGQLTLEHPDAPLRPHTHLVLSLTTQCSAGALQLRFRDPRRFGGVWLLSSPDLANANLGPEPLTLRPDQLSTILSHTRRPIKSALLDQSLIAGLGNIYVDESLFAAGIHPLTAANELSPEHIRRLTRAIKLILRRAIRHRGSSIRDYIDVNGSSGRFQRLHNVYAREDEPCRRCKTAIRRIVLAGRGTHYCPTCQK